MIVKIVKKFVYGRWLYYVVDEDTAKILEGLTGLKTLTTENMERLELLGIRFEEEQQ